MIKYTKKSNQTLLMNEKQIRANERKKWADWIGDTLAIEHPTQKALLWAIAEAIERDDFGVVAKAQCPDPKNV